MNKNSKILLGIGGVMILLLVVIGLIFYPKKENFEVKSIWTTKDKNLLARFLVLGILLNPQDFGDDFPYHQRVKYVNCFLDWAYTNFSSLNDYTVRWEQFSRKHPFNDETYEVYDKLMKCGITWWQSYTTNQIFMEFAKKIENKLILD